MATTRRVTAQGGGPGAGLDRLGVLHAGLAEVGVEVDEPGATTAARGVEDGWRRRWCSRSAPTSAIAPPASKQHVGPALAGERRRRVPPLSTARSLAVQPSVDTHRPLRVPAEQLVEDRHAHGHPVATCSLMTDRGSSATRAAISTPRLVGPGCMIRASAGRRASRSAVTPQRAAVLPQRREQRLGDALLLDPQHVEDVEVGQDLVEVVG